MILRPVLYRDRPTLTLSSIDPNTPPFKFHSLDTAAGRHVPDATLLRYSAQTRLYGSGPTRILWGPRPTRADTRYYFRRSPETATRLFRSVRLGWVTGPAPPSTIKILRPNLFADPTILAGLIGLRKS